MVQVVGDKIVVLDNDDAAASPRESHEADVDQFLVLRRMLPEPLEVNGGLYSVMNSLVRRYVDAVASSGIPVDAVG